MLAASPMPCLAMGYEVANGLFLQGFATLGLARSSAGGAEFVRDLSQSSGIRNGRWSARIDSILGVQANWQMTPALEWVAQVASRLRHDGSHHPEWMWSCLRWDPTPQLTLRFGRIGADFMMFADSRLIGYSYLPVRPPPDFFAPLFFYHFDGLDLTVGSPIGGHLLRAKLFAGETRTKTASDVGIWDTQGSPVRGLVLDYLHGPWLLRWNLAEIRFSRDMNIGFILEPLRAYGMSSGDVAALKAADSLTTAGKASRFAAFGLGYEAGAIRLQAMVNRIKHGTRVFQDSSAAFVLFGYRFGDLTPYVIASRWKTSPAKDVQSIADPILAEAYRDFIAYADVDRKTFAVGLRWDFRPQQAIKVQWDNLRAKPDAQFSFANVERGWNGRTRVLSVALDVVL